MKKEIDLNTDNSTNAPLNSLGNTGDTIWTQTILLPNKYQHTSNFQIRGAHLKMLK